MYECESWTIKKAECQTIDTFELWCWRRFLRVPRTTRRSNQSILKEYSLEALILKQNSSTLATWCKNWLFGKDPDAGKDWGQEEKGTTEDEMFMTSPTQWTWVWVNSGSCWWTGRPGVLRFMGSQRGGHDCATELNWTEWTFPSRNILIEIIHGRHLAFIIAH